MWADSAFECRSPSLSLFYDLEMARLLDEELNAKLPLTFNHLFTGGYFVTPSARMGENGEIGIGFTYAHPYTLFNGRIQPFRHLEFTANYRIFQGVKDPGLSPDGFGDYADRGANFKFSFMLPEDSYYAIPGIAIGIDDFIGSKKFTTYYVVGTMVWINANLETSIGWGAGRYTHGPSRGFFGGGVWFPFWSCGFSLFEGLGLALEYDPTNYKDPKREPHPEGRHSSTPLNFGVHYVYSDFFDLSLSCIRGEEYAASGSMRYNWGETTGLLPKVLDPCPYIGPKETEPLGCFRTKDVMIQTIHYALECQGFLLTKAWLEENDCGEKKLILVVINQRYRSERETRHRFQTVLASLLPCNIDKCTVGIETCGLVCQSYCYTRELLTRYACKRIGEFEFDILTPRRGALRAFSCGPYLFHRRLDAWNLRFSPRVETFFGSAKGKVKYDVGVKAQVDGYLPYDIFYELQCSYTVLSSLNDVGDFDRYNPSQLPNVLTDYVNYRRMRNFSTDRAYLEKNWPMKGHCFARISGGYFQVNYAGLAGELLFYPPQSYIALGVEGALLKKRHYHGLGFQSVLRTLKDKVPSYHPYTFLNQWFFNFYLDVPELKVAGKVGVGGFLAHDKGVRLECTRYFDSGLRITGWMTFTNAKDMMHGEKYFNRGIAFEVPLDLFSRCRHRKVWNYGLAAWLRDAGAFIPTGHSLFDLINRERRL